MNRKSIIAGVALALLATAGPSDATPRQQRVRWEYSGSYVNTASDTNDDGVKGSLSIVGLKGTPGALTAQVVQEYKFAAQDTCPNGNAGFVYRLAAGGDVVHRVERTGDLIIGKFTSAMFCFDPTTEVFFVKRTERVTGGTGRFANATGRSNSRAPQGRCSRMPTVISSASRAA